MCTKCKQLLPLDKYYNKASTKDKKACACKQCINLQNKLYIKDKPQMKRKIHWKNRYGMTEKEYFSLLEKQDNTCAICLHKSEDFLFVDHCHKSLKVRGLLCKPCNTAIGMFKDCPENLRRAIAYLEGA